jgi:hypothetical protein
LKNQWWLHCYGSKNLSFVCSRPTYPTSPAHFESSFTQCWHINMQVTTSLFNEFEEMVGQGGQAGNCPME